MTDHIWLIYRVPTKRGPLVKLGTVKAKNNPEAMLKAFKAFDITKNADQRRITAYRIFNRVPTEPPCQELVNALRAAKTAIYRLGEECLYEGNTAAYSRSLAWKEQCLKALARYDALPKKVGGA